MNKGNSKSKYVRLAMMVDEAQVRFDQAKMALGAAKARFVAEVTGDVAAGNGLVAQAASHADRLEEISRGAKLMVARRRPSGRHTGIGHRIITLLRRRAVKMTTKEISEHMGDKPISVSKAIYRLAELKRIKRVAPATWVVVDSGKK